ncbi:hypothetical protein BDY19DRAFT_1010342 [Irpex rosettiformis]|uniref:Uncharacterized protein n=1 Tax=Irpex rosettiformis TaxID=378272 RepID=A0ACB8U071_9APHY|nr:hypothetical protein BDY19DRAFT_1010342 [Irpex rosettiformis]
MFPTPTASPLFFFLLLDDVHVSVQPNLDEYVRTADFNNECYEKVLKHAYSSSNKGDGFEDESLWSSDDMNLYYAGVGLKGRGPKPIYKTSEDIFEAPSGPEAYKRLMRVIAVPDTHEFSPNVTWDAIRDQVVVLLNQKIKVTSVDFVRFTWLNKHADWEIKDDENNDEDDEDDDAKKEEDLNYDDIPRMQSVEYGDCHYTNLTIWIGVLPDTLIGGVAHDPSKDIHAFLNLLQVQNIDIAYRESLHKPLLGHGPALFSPVEDGGSLQDVIDNTTMQDTLGPYFHVGDKLYAITVRHNVFTLNGDNKDYHYHDSVPKKEVIVMSTPAFKNYLASIQALIGTHIDAVVSLEKKIKTFRGLVQNGINVVESQKKLGEHETELANIRIKIEDLKNFFVDIKKKFVRWIPFIGVGVAPHRYTRDLCVIELDKEKFKYMIGNVLSLGPEMSESMLKSLIYEHVDVPSDSKYPDDRGMLTADQVNNPTNLNPQDDHIRRVLKRSFTANTTIGTLTRFMSFVRQWTHPTSPTRLSSSGSGILVKAEFPGANLYFVNLEEFLADVT